MKFFVVLMCFVIQETTSVEYTVYDGYPNEVYAFDDRQQRFYYPYEYSRNLELDARAQEFAGNIQFKYYKFVLKIDGRMLLLKTKPNQTKTHLSLI